MFNTPSDFKYLQSFKYVLKKVSNKYLVLENIKQLFYKQDTSNIFKQKLEQQ